MTVTTVEPAGRRSTKRRAPPVARPVLRLARAGDHRFDELLADASTVAGNVLHGGAERLHRPALFIAEGVGEDYVQAVALGGAHHGERDAGRARRVLDDGRARAKVAACLGAGDDRHGHAVFHAPVGFAHSSLARSLECDPGGTTERSSMSGVPPMPPSTPSPTAPRTGCLAMVGPLRHLQPELPGFYDDG